MTTPFYSARPRVRPYSKFYYGPNDFPLVRTLVQSSPGVQTPVGPRRVRIFNYETSALVRERWSDPALGELQFVDLPDGVYFAIAFDPDGAHPPVAEGPVTLPIV